MILRHGTSRPGAVVVATGGSALAGRSGATSSTSATTHSGSSPASSPTLVTAIVTTVATMPPAVQAPWNDGRMVRP